MCGRGTKFCENRVDVCGESKRHGRMDRGLNLHSSGLCVGGGGVEKNKDPNVCMVGGGLNPPHDPLMSAVERS